MKDITYDPQKGKWETSDGWYFNTYKKARDHLKSKKDIKIKETKSNNNKPKNKDDGTK